jgi:RND family efflux transporter MFP subunit
MKVNLKAAQVKRSQRIKICVAMLSMLTSQLVVSGAFAHGDEDHSKKSAASNKASESKKSATGALTLRDATAPQRLPDGSLFVPKLVQRQLQLKTAVAEQDDWPHTLELNGKVIADPNAGGKVQASQAGRIESNGQSLPSLGQRVSKGQVLAYLRPVMSSLDRGNSTAILADLDAQLSIAEKKLQRYEALAEALPKATIETARYDAEALRKRKAAVEVSLYKMEALVAPVSGVISVANATAGQVVDARETLFEIIDPNRLLVEALSYEAVQTGDVVKASATWNIASNAGPSDVVPELQLSFVGGGQQMREQAIPLLFRVVGKNQNAAVGQTLQIFAQKRQHAEGVALPAAALFKLTNAQQMVWVHTEAERFVARAVQVKRLDAQRVVITSGLQEGERVLISGASLLAQVK